MTLTPEQLEEAVRWARDHMSPWTEERARPLDPREPSLMTKFDAIARALLAVTAECERLRGERIQIAQAGALDTRDAEQRTAESIARYFRDMQDKAHQIGNGHIIWPSAAAKHVELIVDQIREGAWRAPTESKVPR